MRTNVKRSVMYLYSARPAANRCQLPSSLDATRSQPAANSPNTPFSWLIQTLPSPRSTIFSISATRSAFSCSERAVMYDLDRTRSMTPWVVVSSVWVNASCVQGSKSVLAASQSSVFFQ